MRHFSASWYSDGGPQRTILRCCATSVSLGADTSTAIASLIIHAEPANCGAGLPQNPGDNTPTHVGALYIERFATAVNLLEVNDLLKAIGNETCGARTSRPRRFAQIMDCGWCTCPYSARL